MNQQMQQIQGSGGGKGGGGGRAPREAPNTLQTISRARVLDIVSEGEIVGPADGLKSVYLDGVPIQNGDDSYNFSNIVLEWRNGTPDQDTLSGFPDVQTPFAINTKVTVENPVVRSVGDVDADAVLVTLRFPSLYSVNTSNGDTNKTTIQFAVDVQPHSGSYTEVLNETLTDKTTSPAELSWRVPLDGDGPWFVRVRRITADSDTSSLANDIYWSVMTVVRDHRLIYPNTALFGVSSDAEAFGGRVPERSYDLKGLIIQVPTNYNPETRLYSGLWDGTFKLAFSNNPAWVLYDLTVNSRYGLGQYIDTAQVDKYTLYEIGKYCDELVPDGFGDLEPRYTFNGVINNREDAMRVISAVTSVFRGMSYWSSGAVSFTADMPSDPVKLVSPANVVGGVFTYTGSSQKARHTVALVTWQDPDLQYRENIEVVEDPEGIERFGIRQTEVLAVGCTSGGQARRAGKWILDSEKHETEVVTYVASWDHADLLPGNLIQVMDPDYAGVDAGGRIVSVNETKDQLMLDRTVIINSGETYHILVTLANGQLQERELTNSAGETDVLSFIIPLDDTPVTGAAWILKSSSVEPRNFRVLSIRETDKHLFEISALFHDPTKYARIEQDLVVEPPNYTELIIGPIQPPTNLSYLEYLYLENNITPRAAVTISWSGSPDPRVVTYEVQSRRQGQGYIPVGNTSSLSLDILAIETGTYDFRVRALDGLNVASSWLEITGVSIQALLAPPDDVQNFRINVVGDYATLTWSAVPNVNASHYVIRYSQSTSGVPWGNATVLLDNVTGTTIQTSARVGTYLIKAVTYQGNVSQNATSIVSNVASLQNYNVVETAQEHPDWAGEKTNTIAIDGELQLVGNDTLSDWTNLGAVQNMAYGIGGMAPEGVYEGDQIIDLGSVYDCLITPQVVVSGQNIVDTMDAWITLASVDPLSGANASQWDAIVEISTTDDDPNGSPTWADWHSLTVGNYSARAFKFRIKLFSYTPAVTPIVQEFSIQIDMPDRNITGEDVTVPIGGLTITFTPAFKGLRTIVTSGQDMASGDYLNVTNKTVNGFDVEFFNSNNDSISRTLDYVAVGYGSS